MGDKGGKKDKSKIQKQKKSKQAQKTKEKLDKQPKKKSVTEKIFVSTGLCLFFYIYPKNDRRE